VRVEFDAGKNARNIASRGLSFEFVAHFEWDSALAVDDRRRDYGERRVRAIGYLGPRLHVVVFVPLDDGVRVISVRRANRRETKLYGQAAQADANGR
jgi:uncharacterized DUF497 family protein